jgi:hypothetical protein
LQLHGIEIWLTFADRIWATSSRAKVLMLLLGRWLVLLADLDMAAGTGKASALTRGLLESFLPRRSSAWKSTAFRLVPSVSSVDISRSGHWLTEVQDYIGNEQETQRNPSINDEGEIIEAVSSNIDDRTMHEV